MLKFSANLSMLFTEYEFMDRFAHAAKNGFKAVEYMFPYAYSKQQLRDQLDDHNLTHILHNLPAGNWEQGERGIACLPNRVSEFQDGVGAAIEYAKLLGNDKINCLIGKTPQDANKQLVDQTVIDNLSFAANELKKENIQLLIEPINNYDIPGFYLQGTEQALDLIKSVNSNNLYVQYDIYHMQRTEGELAETVAKHLNKIGHIQIADNPGRNEPGSGEINYEYLFSRIAELGYKGWIGCEYKPKQSTETGLKWLKKYQL
ncbi:hydroxypyruvate isomerase [Pragia fontium]|uniref:Hydroxypyruvate isomerase n=2 Tax=Pragia fontium TaxID=82985 RepID=A0AAJ5BFX2_9GAMM|nr:hydroxypyruvate isomerase [Pragia fontium]AKJ41247.1 hydroxypyruvate isomerase [Pragia fontium]SFC08211.1 hydroxypyruvate isomerase [Pragia fontium DSM 5563 = ATCC 49100]SUB81469.1 Hydroxypyruvate isomerase [Pragia fontium]VEJ53777.1 Hydroxypyruvate isomerase [Pragia fontium]GKX62787.1 hydroxypyruvate isomerase [Pragia fontium]